MESTQIGEMLRHVYLIPHFAFKMRNAKKKEVSKLLQGIFKVKQSIASLNKLKMKISVTMSDYRHPTTLNLTSSRKKCSKPSMQMCRLLCARTLYVAMRAVAAHSFCLMRCLKTLSTY